MERQCPACGCKWCMPHCVVCRIKFDSALGLVRHNNREVVAVHVLVTLLDVDEDEETAIPNDEGSGLRVTRRVQCAAADANEKDYFLTCAGPSSVVQWLIRASEGSVFFVMAKAKDRGEMIAFNCLAYLEIHETAAEQFKKYVRGTAKQSLGSLVTFSPQEMTPLRRRATLADPRHAVEILATQPFDKRQKLD